MKEFSGLSNIKIGWNDYQGVIHNTYHGGHIENYHHFICSIPEDVEKHFVLPNFTSPMTGTLRKVLENDMAPRDNISLNGLGMTKVKSIGLSMILKTVMEVAQYYTVFSYGPPIPHNNVNPQVIKIVAQPGMKPAPKFVLTGHSK